jgi:hypothetical protein
MLIFVKMYKIHPIFPKNSYRSHAEIGQNVNSPKRVSDRMIFPCSDHFGMVISGRYDMFGWISYIHIDLSCQDLKILIDSIPNFTYISMYDNLWLTRSNLEVRSYPVHTNQIHPYRRFYVQRLRLHRPHSQFTTRLGMARTKYSERFCAYCNKPARMVIVGEMQGAQDKMWFRCTRCHHMSLIDLGTNGADPGNGKLDPATATQYSPELSFKVGEAIFHTGWNDIGKVVNKVKTSNGGQAIVVSFEKQGQRRLIENIKPEVVAELG